MSISPLIKSEADEIERGQRLTPAVLDALHRIGAYRALVPKIYGGFEAKPWEAVAMAEALACADASTAWCVGQAAVCAMSSAYMNPTTARKIWADDEKAVLAWGFPQGARAKVVDGGYVVSGRWGFGSGGHHATWIGGHCQIEEKDGSLRLDRAGNPVEITMLLRQKEVTWEPGWDVIGLRGTGSEAYHVHDLFVPLEHTVRRDVDDERTYAGMLYQFSTTHMYASCFAGVILGIARRVLEEFKVLAGEKSPSASNVIMRQNPVTQAFVAKNEALLGQSKAWLNQILRDAWDHVEVAGTLSLHHKAMIRLAATSAIHRAREVAEACYQEAGATAIFKSNPFERPCRDIHAAGQQVQSRSSHLEAVGAYLLGLDPALRFL
jgi:alkylation response protein AidB-like acyl-CoA dehydrogenase